MTTKLLLKFQEYCKDKTIAVVGNSSCLFDKSYGELIDSHDIVIRFNWALESNIKRWPANVGTKFDVYVFAIRSASKLRSILNRGILRDKDFVIRTRHDDSYYLDEKDRKRILYYSAEEFKESISNEYFVTKEPSSGAMITQFLIDCVDFKSISLFGFDFFESSNNRPQESNEFKSFFFNAHHKGMESHFFKSLISEYKGTGKFKHYK